MSDFSIYRFLKYFYFRIGDFFNNYFVRISEFSTNKKSDFSTTTNWNKKKKTFWRKSEILSEIHASVKINAHLSTDQIAEILRIAQEIKAKTMQ